MELFGRNLESVGSAMEELVGNSCSQDEWSCHGVQLTARGGAVTVTGMKSLEGRAGKIALHKMMNPRKLWRSIASSSPHRLAFGTIAPIEPIRSP